MFTRKLVQSTFVLGTAALTLCGCSKSDSDERTNACAYFTSNPLLQAELLRTQRSVAEGTQSSQAALSSQDLQAQSKKEDQQTLSTQSVGQRGDDELEMRFGEGFADARATIVGHTTISNPSWTSILTGVYSETSGVINNVFDPSTYTDYTTIYNQLEDLDSRIGTTHIADWDLNLPWEGRFDR